MRGGNPLRPPLSFRCIFVVPRIRLLYVNNLNLLVLTPVRGDNPIGGEGRSAYAPLRYAQHRAVPSLPFSFSPRAPFSLSSLSPVPPSRRPASARSCACAPPSLTFLVLLPSMFCFTKKAIVHFSIVTFILNFIEQLLFSNFIRRL